MDDYEEYMKEKMEQARHEENSFEALLKEHGYEHTRLLPTGEWAGIRRMAFTTGIFVGLDDWGYRIRYCFDSHLDAVLALAAWTGEGDPPGPCGGPISTRSSSDEHLLSALQRSDRRAVAVR